MKPLTPAELKGLFWYFPASARDRKWGIYITTVGVTRVGPHQPYPPTGHPEAYDYQWTQGKQGRVLPVYAAVYISRGRGWLDLKGAKRQPIEAGHVILLFPGMWHHYIPNPEVGWDEHWVAFDGVVARRWMRECSFSPAQPVVKSHDEKALLALYTGLIETAQESPAAMQQLMAAKVHAILAALYSEQQTDLSGSEVAAALMRRAQAHMQAEFTSHLDVQRLARELNVSYRRFRDLFVQQTGFSPHQYLIDLRLAHARALLTQTTLNIKEVATQSGFADEYYFSRLFKARVGHAPTEWRAWPQRPRRKR
jgi:AraC-like DNA-binding protein